jgi:DNA-directed RNA polymerase alpha subunit
MALNPTSAIEELALPVRAMDMLRGNFPEIETAWQLAELEPHKMLRVGNFGRKSLAKIEEALALCGLRLGHHHRGSFPVVAEPGPWFAFCL